MRLLHTSDWHVGKAMRGASRAAEHEAVLAEIVGIANEREVDVVLVAGDLFETAAPSPESERIVYRALLGLAADARRPVAVISGNHDNSRRLAAVAPLLALGGVTVQTALASPDHGGVLAIDVGAVALRVAMVPFPSQRYVVHADDLMGLGADKHAQLYDDRLRKVIEALAGGFADGAVNVVLAHLFCAGGVLGGGERSAHTIIDYSVSVTAFPATAHYVALGHLHRAQSLAGPCPIFYSGSPLQMDFGESSDTKAVLVIDADPGVPASVTEVPLTSGRDLRTLKGTLTELEGLVGTTGDAFLRVEVDEPSRAGLADDVRQLFPDAVEVVVPAGAPGGTDRDLAARAGRTPHELFEMFLAERKVQDPRLVAMFDALLDEATQARAGGTDGELAWTSEPGGGNDAA